MRIRLATQMFLGLFGLSMICSTALVIGFYQVVKREKEVEYRERYEQLSASIGVAFHQMETTARMMNDNAARVLKEVVAQHGLPSEAELMHLAGTLHVQSLDITDETGEFIRSPTVPKSEQPHGLFEYCADYAGLVTGDSSYATTPIMPGYPDMEPRMFTMVPSYDRRHVLESTVTLNFIYEILEAALKRDPNVASIGFFTPNGKQLGIVRSLQGESDLFIEQRVPASVADCCECRFKNIAAEDQQPYFYSLRMGISTRTLQENISELKRRCVRIALLSLGGAALIAFIVGRKLAQRIVSMSTATQSILAHDDLSLRVPTTGAEDEVKELANGVNAMLAGLQSSREQAIEHERMATLARVAGQVAHDIRSPLTALNTVLLETRSMPEPTRVLARSAIYRVQDIANDLLAKHRGMEASRQDVHLLFPMVESLISEKRIEYRARLNLDISADVDATGVGVFAKVSPAQLKRVLSNLVNNAAEALGDCGKIVLRLTAADSTVSLEVCDNGTGMSSEVLARLGDEAFTHGKEDGHGLGVSSAMSMVRQWGGTLAYESELGQGTRATIHVPRASPPRWFLEKLDLRGVRQVVVVDDDQSIHGVWRERIGRAPAIEPAKIVHLSSPAELRGWCEVHGSRADALLLVDFEFIGQKETGLDVVESLNLKDRAVLVTSRFEDEEVVARCVRGEIYLMPKPVAAHLPVIVSDVTRADAVLIDDDLLVHSIWELNAIEKRKSVLMFTSAHDFMRRQGTLDRGTPIYVDAELGRGERGDVVSKAIADLGFVEIYLATGCNPSEFGAMPWIKDVRDKCGPF